MTKIVYFTDFHLHNYSEFANPVTAELYHGKVQTTDRVVNQLRALDAVFTAAIENKALLIFGGDFYHQRASVPTQIFNLGFRAVYHNMLRNSNLRFYMLVGNHDMITNQIGCPNSLESFNMIDRVTVINKPCTRVYKDLQLGFMPYCEDISWAKKQLSKINTDNHNHKDHNVLVAHLGIDGAKQGRYNHRLASAYSLADLHPSVNDYVLLGHYHKRQNLADNVFYGGNTVPNSFDDDVPKGYYLIDIDKHTAEFKPIMNPLFLTFNDENISQLTPEVEKNNYIRVQISKNRLHKIKENLSITNDDLPSNVRLEEQKSYEVKSRIDIDVASSESDIVRKYCDEFYPDAKDKALKVLSEVI